MSHLDLPEDPNVLVGHSGSDDAGVYRLSEDSALVLSVDFFTPVVDDPYDFGRVAAANSLSDIYAMGGKPIVALNIAAFPEADIAAEVFGEVLRGGADVARQAGVAVIGGHTVDDKEVKYGLSVVGMIDPRRIITNAGASAGDRLILTKPLGSGVLSTALMAGRLDDDAIAALVAVMTMLNQEASQLMIEHGVRAATDITGYALAGHASEMAAASGVTIEIDSSAVPVMNGAIEAARAGARTGGAAKNQRFLADVLRVEGDIDEALLHLHYDPQTSGGLLIAVGQDRADALLQALRVNHAQAAIVGRCLARADTNVVIR